MTDIATDGVTIPSCSVRIKYGKSLVVYICAYVTASAIDFLLLHVCEYFCCYRSTRLVSILVLILNILIC